MQRAIGAWREPGGERELEHPGRHATAPLKALCKGVTAAKLESFATGDGHTAIVES